MAGGDMHVRVGVGHFKATNQTHDASSKPDAARGLTNPISMSNGDTAYVSDSGKSALSQFEGIPGYKLSSHPDKIDKGLIFEDIVSNLPAGFAEQNLGLLSGD